MKSRGIAVFLIAVVLGVALGAWWARRSETPTVDPEAALPQTPQQTAPTGSAREAAGPDPEVAQAPAPESSSDVREIRAWLSQEARGVGIQVDEMAHRRAIQQKVRGLTSAQWREVTRLILSPDENANERILAAFMLGMGGLSAPDVLERVLDDRLPEGPQRPHSEDEVRSMRERSLRLMIIDGLIAEAKADPGKREALAQAIRRIDDPYLRDLAKRRARAEGLE